MSDLDASGLVSALRAKFDGQRTRPLSWRHAQLDALKRLLTENETAILDALADDLGKPRFESWAGEIQATIREIDVLRRNLERWTRQETVGVPLAMRPGRASIRREPVGVVLVIAPWNYPVHLLATPVAAALAAGNAVIAKPSELVPATSALICRLADEYLDAEAVRFVEGGPAETTELLKQRFDHIFFTGGGEVGRIVLEAAARHLTPTTLELGGKTPAIVTKNADLTYAAGRIAFAKWSNAGQTCVAVDHVLIDETVEDEFLAHLAAEVERRYGSDPQASPDFGRVVNDRHLTRLSELLEAGGFDEIVVGGTVDATQRYVAPTVLRGVKPDAAVMADEIFGPILPVLTFADLDEAIAGIRSGPTPLALYVFSHDADEVARVLDGTASGGVCVNDVMSQLFVPELPFGGVGASGFGSYHGRWGLDTFSHLRSVYRRPNWFKELALFRPPYAAWKLKLGRRLF